VSAELPPGVGTVGEELSKLLAALSARQGSAGRGPVDPEDEQDPEPEDQGLGSPADEPDEAGDGRLRREEPAAQSPAEDQGAHCTCGCHTGSVPMGQAQVCSLCPLCQGIATLRSLNPELLDRLAHLASLAADVLRELAADAAAGRAPRPEPPRPRSRPTRPERVDIDVVDEPSGDARGGGEAQG
jgi:hypothetical protein